MSLEKDLFISGFKPHSPPYLKSQGEALQWLAEGYARANADTKKSPEDWYRALWRVGCKPPQIQTRAHYLPDFQSGMEPKVFDLTKDPRGAGAYERNLAFHRISTQALEDLFRDEPISENLLHITCTGYHAPSAAQELVSRRRRNTEVTHMYHMGCYAAIPALRVGSGLLKHSKDLTSRVDLVHTELCTLHLDLVKPSLEQMVIQTLFADGIIRYSLGNQKPVNGFRLLSLKEVILSNSLDHMKWVVSDHGMQMTLSQDIPGLIKKGIREVVEGWLDSNGILFSEWKEKALFAVHPGGPKIVSQIGEALSLREDQLGHSLKVLSARGNMSSATLPHIWDLIERDPSVVAGTPILSMAFGPGLTVAVALLEKL